MTWSVCLVAFALGASAGTPERDKAWSALIDQARTHGGVETKLDRSATFVFQRPDGSYLTFTQLLSADKARSVCLVAKDENTTACVNWDTGKLTLGSRPDPATPWRFRSAVSLDAFEAQKPGIFQKLLTSVQNLVLSGKRSRRSDEGGYWRYSEGNMHWVNTTPP